MNFHSGNWFFELISSIFLKWIKDILERDEIAKVSVKLKICKYLINVPKVYNSNKKRDEKEMT